jgi:hypothetical protein
MLIELLWKWATDECQTNYGMLIMIDDELGLMTSEIDDRVVLDD